MFTTILKEDDALKDILVQSIMVISLPSFKE